MAGKKYAIDFKMSDGSVKTVEFEVPLAELVGALMRDGTTPMEANLPMGGFRVTEVGAPASDGDAVNKGYVDKNFRPATWTPTAADVGARPNTWMPTASDVGARPNTWMPTADQVGAAQAGLHRSYGSLKDIGITTFPTTMATVVSKMPANSMIVIDTRRINGADASLSTETISDWGNATNGTAIITKGYSNARVNMIINYCTGSATVTQLHFGNYANATDKVNWNRVISTTDKFSKTTLWTNASPNSTFGGQTISVQNLNSYDAVLVDFRFNSASSYDSYEQSSCFCLVGSKTTAICGRCISSASNTAADIAYRTVYASGGDSLVGFLYGYDRAGNKLDNTYAVPVRIYGIKFRA